MLNATMCAVTRVICVLLEMNQTETGDILVINQSNIICVKSLDSLNLFIVIFTQTMYPAYRL